MVASSNLGNERLRAGAVRKGIGIAYTSDLIAARMGTEIEASKGQKGRESLLSSITFEALVLFMFSR